MLDKLHGLNQIFRSQTNKITSRFDVPQINGCGMMNFMNCNFSPKLLSSYTLAAFPDRLMCKKSLKGLG